MGRTPFLSRRRCQYGGRRRQRCGKEDWMAASL